LQAYIRSQQHEGWVLARTRYLRLDRQYCGRCIESKAISFSVSPQLLASPNSR
jgi:hypothetical protein